uniref:Uncharacterized protein n=1 Tax=Oryzias melastigma TaxID=30732 RepID=A0A3B3C9R9_ORYME
VYIINIIVVDSEGEKRRELTPLFSFRIYYNYAVDGICGLRWRQSVVQSRTTVMVGSGRLHALKQGCHSPG